jgi:hypothetical protein
MTRSAIPIIIWLAFFGGLGGLVLLTKPWERAAPAPQSEFLRKYDQIQEEMTKGEVEAVLGRRIDQAWKEEREWTSSGRPLKRASALTVNLNEKGSAKESDYFITVYFDEKGRVVGKDKGVYCK